MAAKQAAKEVSCPWCWLVLLGVTSNIQGCAWQMASGCTSDAGHITTPSAVTWT
jgi:hypothetical protein